MLALVDRMIVIDGGRVIADGPKAEILARAQAPAPAPQSTSPAGAPRAPAPSTASSTPMQRTS
jgi:ATP-binding cassette subfamily C protein LapB